MKLFCLLVVAAFAAGDPGAPHVSGGLTIEQLRALTDVLDQQVKDIALLISDTTTLSGVSNERLLQLTDFDLPGLRLQNSQHAGLISSYAAQAKDMEHRIDDVQSSLSEAQTLASATSSSVSTQIDDYLNGAEVAGVNSAQGSAISALESDINSARSAYINALADDLDTLNSEHDTADNKINQLGDFVASRKCEYGSGSFDPQTTVPITFKTNFTDDPEIILTLTGFKANRDFYSHDNKYDSLALSKFVSNVTTTGFDVTAQDISEGMVGLQSIYCSWMACQNLDVDLTLVHN